MENIKTRLREIFVKALKLQLNPAEIGDTDLIATLGIDSISALEILIWIEDEFKITVEDEDLTPRLLNSLDTIAGYIQNRQQTLAGEAS